MDKTQSDSPKLDVPPNEVVAAPSTFDEFSGQERIKARLQLAIEAAKQRREAPGHILLVGPPGSGKATLANIIVKAMVVHAKSTNAMTIGSLGDFAGLLTNLEEGEVLLIADVHSLDKTAAEYLCQPMKDFNLDIIIDRGPNARSVRLNLPNFTLICTTTRKDRMPASFLSSFQIIADMDAYSNEDLASIARRLAGVMGLEVDEDVPEKVALSARVSPCEVLNRLRHLRDYAHIKAHSKRITTEMAVEALKMLSPGQVAQELQREKQSGQLGKVWVKMEEKRV